MPRRDVETRFAQLGVLPGGSLQTGFPASRVIGFQSGQANTRARFPPGYCGETRSFGHMTMGSQHPFETAWTVEGMVESPAGGCAHEPPCRGFRNRPQFVVMEDYLGSSHGRKLPAAPGRHRIACRPVGRLGHCPEGPPRVSGSAINDFSTDVRDEIFVSLVSTFGG